MLNMFIFKYIRIARKHDLTSIVDIICLCLCIYIYIYVCVFLGSILVMYLPANLFI